MVSTKSQARRYDMPSDLAAEVIDPVPAIASRSSIFPGPTAMSAPFRMRRRNWTVGFISRQRGRASWSMRVNPRSTWLEDRLLNCHRLRKIARLVDVGVAQYRRVISKQLQRDGVDDGRQQACVFRQTQHVDSVAGLDLAVGVGHDVQLAAAGAYFLQVRLELFEQRVVGRDGHDGHPGIDQRQRSVLELAGGIRLAMDVRNFLELERALERDRVMQAAAEEKRVLLFGELLRPGDDRRLQRQHRLDCAGQVSKRTQPSRLVLRAEATARLCQRESEQE